MRRSTDEHILTTVTGSLPRPTELAHMVVELEHGRPVDQADFESELRAAVTSTVSRQAEAGLGVVTDGEMSKAHFVTYIHDRLTGFGDVVELINAFVVHDVVDLPDLMMNVWGGSQFQIQECVGPLTYHDEGQRQLQRDIANYKTALDAAGHEEAFLTVPSPGVCATLLPNKYYKTYDDYVMALAEALHTECQTIVESGLLLQIDAPELACLDNLQVWMWDEHERRGRKALQELYVDAINVALSGIDPDRVRLHLCWMNYMGPHTHDLPLEEALVPALRANVGAINFEGANPAHAHEWALFEHLEIPDDKILIPGVIDSKSNVVEHPRLVAERIVRYAELIGTERLIAGTDCGFATGLGALMVHPKVAWMKIQSLVEGASLASARLSPSRG